MNRIAIVPLLLMLTGTAGAVPVRIVVSRHGTVSGPITLSFANGNATATAIVPSDASEAPAIELQPGHWSVRGDGRSAWFPETHFDVKEGQTTRDVSLNVWATGMLTGALTTTSRIAPTEVELRFEGRSASGDNLENVIDCRVVKGEFRCPFPAGTFNVRLHARRHISRYLWGLRLDANAEHDLGTLELREGSAISGKVELPAELKTFQDVSVVAKASGIHEGNGPELFGASLLPQTVKVEKNGWFHIDGLLPGEYTVHALGPRLLRSRDVNAIVRERAETQLNDAFVLEHPHFIAFRVQPPRAPDGAQWHVTVARQIAIDRLDVVSQSLASPQGSWRSQALQPGKYVLELGTISDDSIWSTETVDLGSADEERALTIVPRTLSGVLRLGEKPLEARVLFSDEKHKTSLQARSAPDGRFRLDVPANVAAWDVTVRRAFPSVQRTLHNIVPSDDGVVTITLPSTILTGTVVDDSGAVVPNALVTIHPIGRNESVIQPATREDGIFEAIGLTTGDYAISAETADSKSTPISIHFREDDAAEMVTLTLHKARFLRGRVISPLGPVAGATVTVVPTDVLATILTSVSTDANGSFVAPLSPDVHEVNVLTAAPGFAYTLDHVPVRDQLLTVAINQQGGTLTLQAPAGKRLTLSRGIVTVPPSLLIVQWIATSSLEAGGRMMIRSPMMDPGPYSLCDESGRCDSGTLDPFGSLTLTLP